MKTIPAALATHLSEEVTTLATLWRIERRDSTILTLTDHDQDILFDGDLYTAASGYSRTAVQTSDQLNPDQLEVEGILDSDELDEADLRNGLYDRAAIEIFLVNWADPAGGRVILRRGWLGEVSQQGAGYQAEIRGLLQAYSQHYGQLFAPECRADLGDSRCQVVLVPDAWQATHVYALGDVVRPTTANGFRFVVTTAGTSGASEPSWNASQDATTTDSTVVWTATAEQFSAEGTIASVVTARREFTATATSGFAFVTTTVLPVPTWQADHRYHPTFSVKPSVANGLRYVTEVKGRSGETEPAWPSEETETVEDNELVWKPVRDEWYQYGLLTWLTGLNAGFTSEVKRYDADTLTFEVFLPTPYPLTAGDTFRVEAGCNKLRSTCKVKFDNLVHFRGEPFVPGINTILDYPDAKALEDLIR